MSTPKRTCSIEGCERKHQAHGWCNTHYLRWRWHGDPEWEPLTLEARFWAKVAIQGPDECWLWTANKLPKGYGLFWDGRTKVYAHRVAYELMIGQIPEGLQIDHVKARGCTSRACVNPAHLEAVTCRENLLRGDTRTAANAAKTHCPQGHPFTGENLYVHPTNGRRACRACGRMYWHRRGERKTEQVV